MNNCALQISHVPFGKDTIPCSIDAERIIWCVVSSICYNLGFTNDQERRQIKNMQNDLALSLGCKKLRVKFDTQAREVLCIKNDYLPLWLAKISITPTMKREQPYLVDKLVHYQLEAKDVLAEYFMGKSNEEICEYSSNGDDYITRDQLAAFVEEMSEAQQRQYELFESFFARFNDSMRNLTNVIIASQTHNGTEEIQEAVIQVEEDKKVEESEEETEELENNINSEISGMKPKVYRALVNDLLKKICERIGCRSKGALLTKVCKEITKKYGIVWDQEKKEFYREHGYCSSNLLTFISESDDEKYYKGILVDMLRDMYANSKEKEITEAKTIDGAYELVELIGTKRQDNSPHYVITFNQIYKRMNKDNDINWDYFETVYKKKNGITSTKKKIHKKDVIANSCKLKKIFIREVNDIMKEMSNV